MPNNKEDDAIWIRLRHMPELSHYPDRSRPFNPRESEVLQFIQRLIPGEPFERAISLFKTAQRGIRGPVITFDPVTRRWRGNKSWSPAWAHGGQRGLGLGDLLMRMSDVPAPAGALYKHLWTELHMSKWTFFKALDQGLSEGKIARGASGGWVRVRQSGAPSV